MKIGMIGLDTSHCTAFTRLLNDPRQIFMCPVERLLSLIPADRRISP